MAARFNAGASVRSTRYLSSANKMDGIQGKGMRAGMPGFIATKQDKSSSGLIGEKQIAPKGTGPIGKRGSSGEKANYPPKAFGGSSDKSYYGTSTAPPGTYKNANTTPSPRKAVDQRDSGRRSGNSRAPLAGVHTESNRLGQPGSRGKMESLRGRALTSSERR
jgi:hypothetical protein